MENNIKFIISSVDNEDGLTKYFVNDILVATKQKSMHHYHTNKGEYLSALRDKEKLGYECKWNEDGIKKLFGNKKFVIAIDDVHYLYSMGIKNVDFKESEPNYRTGYNGNLFSKIFIKESIYNY